VNRWLQSFNLFGVLALAVLCGVQWQRNRRVNLEVEALIKSGAEQAGKLKEHDRAVKGCTADLESFRTQVANNHETLQLNEAKAGAAARLLAQITNERDQLKSSVASWTAAVTARDDQLKVVGERLRKAADERNELVTKWNGLGEKYNALVQQLADRTRQLNQLLAQRTTTAAQ
jgi:chromosome segregation ATPase